MAIAYIFNYVETNIFCSVLLGFLLYKCFTALNDTERKRNYAAALLCQGVYLILDALRAAVYGGMLPRNRLSLYAVHIVCYAGFTYVMYRLPLGLELYQDDEYQYPETEKRLYLIPCLFQFAMLAATPFTKLYFSFDETLKKKNGILWPLMVMIGIGYAGAAVVRAIRRTHRDSAEGKMLPHSNAVILPVLMVIFSILQGIFRQLPLMAYGLAMGNLFVYINYIHKLISRDPLTHVNNRNELNRYLTFQMRQNWEERMLYLLILDLDHFKAVNDTYGHKEGDRALVTFADALKKASAERKRRCFLSRFGGDEFIIVTEAGMEEEVKEFVQVIRRKLKETVAEAGLPYELKTSIGYARYEKGTEAETITGLIRAADQALYEEKKRNR